jgi:hypothetical protein
MEFQILCGGVFLGSPGSLESIVHVKSLDDCLEKCAISHPLCTGVSYVADLRGTGWLNCRLIRFLVDPRMAPYTRTMGHSAGASIRKLPEGADCREESNRKDQHGRSYKLSCSDFRDLNNTEIPPLEMHHEDKLDDCITRCSNAMPLCNTIVFDEGLQSGFQNCYLFDDFPPPQSRKSNYTFLYLENLSSRFQSPPPIQSAHLNTGQIVGVALGSSTVVVGLSIWLVVWRRKRKNGIKVKST